MRRPAAGMLTMLFSPVLFLSWLFPVVTWLVPVVTWLSGAVVLGGAYLIKRLYSAASASPAPAPRNAFVFVVTLRLKHETRSVSFE